MHLVQIVAEDDDGEESTVGWTHNLKTNSPSFSVSVATKEKKIFTSGDFKW